jgi:adenine/guanine phosphoribosyltransferase-like PRPP-binding protein
MSYLLLDHDKRQEVIDLSVAMLSLYAPPFDSVVCHGLSGVLVAPAIAKGLHKPIVIVRKKESTHGYEIEIDYNVEVGRYLIIDDLVETGKTIRYIRKKLAWDYSTTCAGVFFYDQSDDSGFLPAFREMNQGLWIRTMR